MFNVDQYMAASGAQPRPVSALPGQSVCVLSYRVPWESKTHSDILFVLGVEGVLQES